MRHRMYRARHWATVVGPDTEERFIALRLVRTPAHAAADGDLHRNAKVKLGGELVVACSDKHAQNASTQLGVQAAGNGFDPANKEFAAGGRKSSTAVWDRYACCDALVADELSR